METAKRIFELLQSKKMEQQEFASVLGVSKNTVSNWKSGNSSSYKKYIPQIAEILGTTTEYLLTGKQAEPTSVGEFTEEEFHILRQIHDRPDMRVMFSLTSKATDEDVRKAAEIIRAFLGTPEDDP